MQVSVKAHDDATAAAVAQCAAMPLVDPLPADHDPEVERLAAFFAGTLSFARAAASVPGDVTPEIAGRLRAHWDDGEIVEITGVVALFGYLNRSNDAMATELESPAAADGERWFAGHGWSAGKHGR